ncbi:zinc finger CCCH-type with G patch domain-containing protein [Bacillus rossius redtenbacheri]|uniref:zinc finger CCCH-type with G patch domain-containing protein n=1 Tax=Bacillus rossius redtenbacheri TaxID=93214 RepID=UPI002FDC7CAF
MIMDLLKKELSQYQTQLSQIELAVAASSPGPDRDNLVSLQADIQELIKLTNENVTSLQQQQNFSSPSHSAKKTKIENDPFAEEYALFKAELEKVEASNDHSPPNESVVPAGTSDSLNFAEVQKELESLQGTKCQAPHCNQYGDQSYHNALVFCIEPAENVTSMEQIQVRVMFTNPTHRDMLPCPYYLGGECRFSSDKCRFSHGELVHFSSLREYREPDFSLVRSNVRVLVKCEDQLWHTAVVLEVDRGKCLVKLEGSGVKTEVELASVLPLGDSAGESVEVSSSSSSDSSDSDSETRELEERNQLAVSVIERTLLSSPTTALGDWEKHTKGIGSSLMARMGYITGAGLGKNSDGRIEPVEALVLPAGKSLDHCMNLREQAGGDEDLFKVEKKLKRLQKKQEEQRARMYERDKQQRKNVFDFLNTTLSGRKEGDEGPPGKKGRGGAEDNLRSETSRGLNVASLRVGEDIRRAEREAARLQESLARHTEGSQAHGLLSGRLREKRAELARLRASERSVDQERSQRIDRKKMAAF